MIQLVSNENEVQRNSATNILVCTQCGKNLRVVKELSIFRNDDGTFCGLSCSQFYKASHDHSSLLGRLMNDHLEST